MKSIVIVGIGNMRAVSQGQLLGADRLGTRVDVQRTDDGDQNRIFQ